MKSCEVCEAINNEKYRIAETDHWVISLSQDQYWLGRSYVTAKKHTPSLSELSNDQWTDLQLAISNFESALKKTYGADMFNWTCLMNNAYKNLETDPNPHVHWHVRPRYSSEVSVDNHVFKDEDFGNHYRTRRDGRKDKVLDQQLMNKIVNDIKDNLQK